MFFSGLILAFSLLSAVATKIDLIKLSRSDVEKFLEMVKQLGPAGVGKMLKGSISGECSMPLKSEARSFMVVEEILSEALPNTTEIEVEDFNFVCINHGKHRNKHTAASIVVLYSSKKRQSVTQQFPVLCVKNKWTAVFLDNGPADGALDSQTRGDCQMCASPKIFASASLAEHCVECPESCSSRRCQIDGKCCEVFNLKKKCAAKCPKNSHVGDNDQCVCDRGYRKQRGKCNKVAVRCRCKNGGTCMDGSSRCICPRGFSGRTCQYCDLPSCLKCQYDKVANEAMCIEKEKPCKVRFVKEPPPYPALNCNPFDGTGYTLQCAVEVPRRYSNSILLTWRFVTQTGDGIDLDAPLLEQAISIEERRTNRGDNVEISSVLSASLDDDITVFGIGIKESAFEYLKGGSVYCEPSIEDSDELFLPSSFLTMPTERPNVAPCSHSTVYTQDSDKCADFVPDVMYPDYDEYDEENYPRAESEPEFDPEAARVDGLGLRVSEIQSPGNDSEFHPWIFILGTIGAVLVLMGLVIPMILAILYIKNKKKKSRQLNAPNNLNNSGTTIQNPVASSVGMLQPLSRTAETDSMISQVRKGGYPHRR